MSIFSCPSTKGRLAFLAFGSIAALFLVYEHTAHVLGALPFLLLLACPLMHVFMHHGHHGQHDPTAQTPSPTTGSDGHA